MNDVVPTTYQRRGENPIPRRAARLLKFIGVAFVALAVTAAGALAGDQQLSSDLKSRNLTGNVEVIVQYKVAPTDSHHQRVASLGGTLHSRMDHIQAAHYTVPASAIKTLSGDPDAAYITPNRPLKGMLDTTTKTVHSDVANHAQKLTGNNIGVAVIDSGIGDSPYFSAGQVVCRESFVGKVASYDEYGHGTHVAGIVGSSGHGTVYTGVAPDVNLIDLRVLDANGNGSDAAVINAIYRAIQLRWSYNIRVINLSLGRQVYEPAAQDPLCQAVEAAWKAGIVVVVAAGNDGRDNYSTMQGYGTIGVPGNDPYVITVGAMKSEGTSTRGDDMIASYSSKGPTALDHFAKPDLVAPGNRVVSVMSGNPTLAQLYPGNIKGGGLLTLSGTSMARPRSSAARSRCCCSRIRSSRRIR
jgi:serine protease AprX